MPPALTGWVITIALTWAAFVLRLVKLSTPNKLVFDETYYAKDAWALIHFGYERAWPEGANDRIIAGETDIWQETAAFVVHPPIGKWLIGAGEAMFGMAPFGWRFMPLVFGSLLVFMVIRLTIRLSRSNLIGALAGVLITVDGLSFVMSRVALLDIFQAFFLLAAVAALVVDRDYARAKLADHLEGLGRTTLGPLPGPVRWWRPWRLVAGLMFGLAIGTKWNSLYVLAAFAVLSLAWDHGMRRMAGSTSNPILRVVLDGVPAFIQTVVVAVGVYIASWSAWFATSGGWKRQWAAENPDKPLARWLPDPIASWLEYHREIYGFHTGDFINQATHTYSAHPAGWLVLARPIGIDAVNDIKPGTNGCPAEAEKCLSVVTGLGTPLLWWLAAAALVLAVVWWVGARDWRFGIPVVGVASTWLPWFQYTDRPLFYFYAICLVPFLVIGLSLVLAQVLGPPEPGLRRQVGAIAVGVIVALIVLNFAFFYPVYTDEVLPREAWLQRMWLRSWI
ncbi:dolichyl-phosphate-mannose--protein mannosyltransferase [Enemella sp. A6]|uniref:dolichyl-phosphate-mannose--protein mannosyltransferase n=1 Tax=Enemella sp. A6 TaxID=3440152 RepID=UPI003EBFAE0C